MLPCPYCHSPLREDTPTCPACQFDLARAKEVMGPIPRLDPSGLTDFTRSLSSSEKKRINRHRRAFRHRFPQSRAHIVIKKFPPDFSIEVSLFWLFNLGGFGKEAQKWGQNRDFLIGVDPTQSTLALTMGYGLDPFLSARNIDLVLAAAAPYFQQGDFASGIVHLLENLTEKLQELSREIPNLLGITSPVDNQRPSEF